MLEYAKPVERERDRERRPQVRIKPLAAAAKTQPLYIRHTLYQVSYLATQT